MDLLQQIKEPVAGEMARYEEFLRQSLQSEHRLTQTMIDYILTTRGKAIRPLMVLLSAAMIKGSTPVPEGSLLAAMLVEMTHTASLVHDDVIDEAYIRRGKPSVKALWRTPRAVIIGDYILAKTFSIGMNSGLYDVVAYVIEAMTGLCEGEMLQSEQSDRLEMTRDIYNEIIYNKTAGLIGRCSGAGAMSAGASADQVRKMRDFGDSLGMAFQMKDDILDYSLTANTGKRACTDLRERKITIPLLTVLERSDDHERRKLMALLSDARNSPEKVEKLCNIVIERGGIEMASAAMDEYLTRAREIILSFPASVYRDSIEMLCDYFASREK